MIVNIAKEIGICKAAELYGINRNSVRTWLKKYNDGGLESLQNKSRNDQLQKNKMPDYISEKIYRLKLDNPDYSAKKIKDVLKLDYSTSTIYKKIQMNDLLHETEKKVHDSNYCQNTFTDFYVYIKKIQYQSIPKKNEMNENLNYIIIIEEKTTGIAFTSFSNERTSICVGIFLEYFIQRLKQWDLSRNYNFYLSSSIKMSTNDHIITIVKDKYHSNIFPNTPVSDLNHRKTFAYKYLYDNFFSNTAPKSRAAILGIKTFSYLLVYNLNLISKVKNNDSTETLNYIKK
jgi:transposase